MVPPTRAERIRAATTRPYDLIVIGAGINGAGIARDAALRGLRVLLLDKGDVAAGTTSWSSRLIHGGLRYLEHRELGLVRESLRERERLLRIAPHLVEPLPLLIPLDRHAKRGPLLIRAGMVAYDLLSYDKSLDRHRMLSPEEALEHAPGLERDGLRGAALYFDAQVEYPERLALENALAAIEAGATLLTYARVTRLLSRGGAVAGVALVDVLDEGNEVEVEAPVTINVAGPWVDQVLAAGSVDPTNGAASPPARLIGGTKGSHLVVAPFPGAPRDALYVEARRDGRPFFIIPWNGLILIGTTDLRYEGDLDRVVATEEEIAYLLEETDRILPAAGLTRDDVLYSYAGIRPLPYQPGGKEAAISRRHLIHDHVEAPGLLSIVGGKLTTFRELAEQAVDAVTRKLGRPVPSSQTERLSLPGARADDGAVAGYRRRFLAESGLPERTANHLLRVYGTRAGDIVALAASESDLRQPFDGFTGAIGAEVVWAVREEQAETLADVLLRRTMVGLGPDVGLGAVEAAAEIGRRHLGWDVIRAAVEVEAYREQVERFSPKALAGASV